MKVLLGGGTQSNLTRVLRKVGDTPGVTFDYVTSDADPIVWRRKGSTADVAVVRTGWISHKAWRAVKAYCARVIPLPNTGDEAMLEAIKSVITPL